MGTRTFPKVAIIGSGRVGSSIGMALHERGYPIASVINRSGASALALAKTVHCKTVSTQISDINPASEIVIIAVSDNALEVTVDALLTARKLRWKKLFVAHVSGAASSRILRPAEKLGAIIASMHPIQTFPKSRKRTSVKGIYFGIEGSPAGIERAERIVLDLGARSITVSEELKPLYHAACVYASGYLIVMLNAIGQLSRLVQERTPWTDVFGPLMTSAMENAIRQSPAAALTGPVVRGDLPAIDRHVKALASKAPQLLPLYLVAGIEAARILLEGGTTSREEYQTILRHFRGHIASIPSTTHVKGKK